MGASDWFGTARRRMLTLSLRPPVLPASFDDFAIKLKLRART